MKTPMMLFLLVGLHMLHPCNADDTHSDQYTLCTLGMVAETGSTPLGGRSHLDCLQACSNTAGCAGVNVCPSAGGGSHERPPFVCSLLTDALEYRTCKHLTAASSAECYYAFKNLVCQQGGVADADEYKCQCPVQYAGRTCQRYIREAYENGYQTPVTYRKYFIQPINSPSPFEVSCTSSGGKATVALLRSSYAHMNQDWGTCTAGFGDPTSSYKSGWFFVGLDNLHQLTQQADYRLDFYAEQFDVSGLRHAWYYPLRWYKRTGSTAVYHNFTIGSDLSSYALTYDSFDTAASDLDNGFSTVQPVVFSATGNCGCCVNGSAGWYGSDCSGYSVFSNESISLYWPVNGTLSQLDRAEYRLVRTSDYYDEDY